MMDLQYTVDVRKFGKRDCPACGQELPRSSVRCPRCGHVFSPQKQSHPWVGWVLLGVILWALIRSFLS